MKSHPEKFIEKIREGDKLKLLLITQKSSLRKLEREIN